MQRIIKKTNEQIARLWSDKKNQYHQFHVTLANSIPYFYYYRDRGFNIDARQCNRGFWDISIYWNINNERTNSFIEEVINENNN